MTAVGLAHDPHPTSTREVLQLDRVRSIRFATPASVQQLVRDWFCSPYWHAPERLVDLLENSVVAAHPAPRPGARLVDSALSHTVALIAGPAPDVPVTSLADVYAFPDGTLDTALHLAALVRQAEPTAVVCHLDDGQVIGATLAALLGWIVGESLLHGFAGEVGHGRNALLCDFVETGHRPDPRPAGLPLTALPLAALLPLPAGVAARHALRGRALGVPLAAYPLAAMLLPDLSADMQPTTEPLSALFGDASLGERTGHGVQLSTWRRWRLESRLLLARPLSRPMRAAVGSVARLLARWRDRLAATDAGDRALRAGIDLSRLWSLLRRASSTAANPWLTRSACDQIDTARIVEGTL